MCAPDVIDAGAGRGVHDHSPGPVLVLAGPGTGKTHALAKRVKWLIEERLVSPDDITVITFTLEAARNMRARLSDKERKDVYLPRARQPRMISTMHSLGQRVVAERLKQVGLQEGFRIVPKRLRPIVFEDASQLVGMTRKDGRQVDQLKQRAALRDVDELLRQIAQKYDQVLRASNAIDYDDQIVLASRLLNDDADLRAEYQSHAHHLLVDEYQDINPDQFEFVRVLSAGNPEGLFAVGDDDQSIYGFRGGSPVFMQEFAEHFGVNASIVQLGHSWRCPRKVVEAALCIVQEFNPRRLPKLDFTYEREEEGEVKVWDLPSEKAEAELVTRIVTDTDPASSVLILAPALEYVDSIRSALRRARVPYEVVGDRHRGGLEMFETLGDWVTRPDDNLALRGLLQEIVDGGSVGVPGPRVRKDQRLKEREEALAQVASLWEDVLLEGVSLYEALTTAAGPSNLAALLLERLEELNSAYRASVESFAAAACRTLSPWARPAAMLEEISRALDELGGRGRATSEMSVRIMTMRMAKGIEADTTIIVGLEDGGFPRKRGSVSEQARLLYVSMTRAKAELHLMHARTREAKATHLPESFALKASPFLKAIDNSRCDRKYLPAPGKRTRRQRTSGH